MSQEQISHPIRKITLATISYFLITAILIAVVEGLTRGINLDYVKYVIIAVSILYVILFHKQMRTAKIKHVTIGVILGIVISGAILFIGMLSLGKAMPYLEKGVFLNKDICLGKETLDVNKRRFSDELGWEYTWFRNPGKIIDAKNTAGFENVTYLGESLGNQKVQLIFSPEKDVYYFDSKYFAKPITATQTAKEAGNTSTIQRTEITEITQALEDSVTIEDLVNYLIESLFIRTYLHVDPTVCVSDKSETKDKIIIRYQGYHEYCGNSCYTGKLDFGVEYDKATRKLYLIP